MSVDPKQEAALALHRFGFGPRLGSIAEISADPRGALLAEIERPGAGRITDSDLLTTGGAARAAFNFRQQRKAERLAARVGKDSGTPAAQKEASAPSAAPSGPQMMESRPATESGAGQSQQSAEMKRKPQQPGVPQRIYLQEAKARIDAALGSDIGFVERLAWFWSNHFCVSAAKGPTRALCGAFE